MRQNLPVYAASYALQANLYIQFMDCCKERDTGSKTESEQWLLSCYHGFGTANGDIGGEL